MINSNLMKERFKFDLLPHQIGVLKELYSGQCADIIGYPSSDADKELILGLYIAARLVQPFDKQKIVLASPSFRNSKMIFAKTLLVLEQLDNVMVKARTDSDRYVIKVENSEAYFLPLGNGEKVRGLRPTIFIANSSQQMEQSALDIVQRSFAAISTNPITGEPYLEYQCVKIEDNV